ncbi:MAG: LysM peptidoglycan-binding domain-containing protein [Burkholderiales bacterium]|nr:LysM peptidoglycan-binding domain-containing protein [Burkholderiales bacterium]
MSPSRRRALPSGRVPALGALLLGLSLAAGAADPRYPVTAAQRQTAQEVAQAGVPLSELAPNAPDTHTVQRGDTLWAISKLFLKSPWRWPELWGMNLQQIRNPHLIYPGQVLVLERANGRATLRLAQQGQGAPNNTVKLEPSVRSELLPNGAVASIPLNLIGPFLNEAVVFSSDELANAPRVVATQEGHVMAQVGEHAYVRGDLGGQRDFRLFREATPLRDPSTHETLGYEARFVGTAELVRTGSEPADPKGVAVPDTVVITSSRLESLVGDRLAPVPPREITAYVPHAPNAPLEGQIVSTYGDGRMAGQNQVVAINRGARDGVERGYVLALWHAGETKVDPTDGKRTLMRLPDERDGTLFVFRVFDRVSYALILAVKEPVKAGGKFTQP